MLSMNALNRYIITAAVATVVTVCALENRIFGKFGSVRVYFDDPTILSDNQWGRSWPEGIQLVNSVQAKQSARPSSYQQGARRIPQTRRTYNWQGEELLISFSMPHFADPLCTRLVPPVTWLVASGARVKVLHSNLPSPAVANSTPIILDDDLAKAIDLDTAKVTSSSSDSDKISNSVIELAVERSVAESSLSTLRMHGFKREDIYRMLDKGPWVLAFNIQSCLPRLVKGLQEDLLLNQTQIVHLISHCPYLIAQYARYKGRDVSATVRALYDVGCPKKTFVVDVMRFPSMLATPPDRVRGWMSLLNGFDIAQTPGLFGKMLKKAPFMFYINPPELFDDEQSDRAPDDDVSATASGFVVYESLRVLQLLRALDLPDLDKIVRTQPTILLEDSAEINRRISFLFNLCLDSSSAGYLARTSGTTGTGISAAVVNVPAAGSSASSGIAQSAVVGAAVAAVAASGAAKLLSGTGAGAQRQSATASEPQSCSVAVSRPPQPVVTADVAAAAVVPTISRSQSQKEEEKEVVLSARKAAAPEEDNAVTSAPSPTNKDKLPGGTLWRKRSYAISRPLWRESVITPSESGSAVALEERPAETTTAAVAGVQMDKKNDTSRLKLDTSDEVAGSAISTGRSDKQAVAKVSSEKKPSSLLSSTSSSESDIVSHGQGQQDQGLSSSSLSESAIDSQGQQEQGQGEERPEIIDEATLAAIEASQIKAQQALGSLLLTYPALLSIDYQQMRSAGNALRSAGLRRNEVMLLARRYPLVLSRRPAQLLGLMSFLKYSCGLRKMELAPFLNKHPEIMGADTDELEPKVDYFFQSLGGSQEILRRYPMYLAYDLETHIRPRAEFLRAMGIDPLENGLSFLVSAPVKEVAYVTGVKEELFNKFVVAFSEMWKKNSEKAEVEKAKKMKESRELKEAESRKVYESSNPVVGGGSGGRGEPMYVPTPEDTLLDALDFGF